MQPKRMTHAPGATCTIDECEGRPVARGLCSKHRARLAKYGTTDLPERNWEERFWSYVHFCPTSGCWLWGGAVSSDSGRKLGGYGVFSLSRKRRMAHRVAYELVKGSIPEDLPLDHLCRTRCCVNPDHLEPVTTEINSKRGMAPAMVAWRNGTCLSGHRWTPENEYVNKSGWRSCRTCRNEKLRANRVPKRDPERCRNGHRWTDGNEYRKPDGSRFCRACRNASRRGVAQRQREQDELSA